LYELYSALLRNRAQAALKRGLFAETLQSAEEALELNVEDHKAWFRKACALEGLGRLEDVEDCPRRIDDISVGRPDKERLQKDTSAKRAHILALQERSAEAHKKMLQRGCQKSLFSSERSQEPIQAAEETSRPPALSNKIAKAKPLDDATRMRLTKEGARALLRLKRLWALPVLLLQASPRLCCCRSLPLLPTRLLAGLTCSPSPQWSP